MSAEESRSRRGDVFGYADPMPFLRDRLGFLGALVREQGDFVRFRLGFREVYFLAAPDAVRRLVTTEQSRLRRSAVTQLTRAVLGSSVFNVDGERHRLQRRRMGPMLHVRSIERYQSLMRAVASRQQASWREGECIDASQLARRLALEIGSRALLGVDLSPQADSIERSIRALFGTMNRVDHPLHWLSWLVPSPRNVRVLQAAWCLRRIATETVTHAAAAGTARDTLLGALLDARDRGEIDTSLARDEVALLMVAGHETTAQALAWALYLLARHPEVQVRIQTEIDMLPADAAADAQAALPTLTHAITETLRLYPSSPIFDRYTTQPVRIGEHCIPAGRTVFVSPYVTQRDERWFAAALRFDPDRWRTLDARACPAYFPFGMGARRCLGEAFALAELTSVLTVFLRRWMLHSDDDAPIEPEALVTLRPRRPIRLRLAHREPDRLSVHPAARVHGR